MSAPAVRMIGIHKRFGPVRANDGVDLTVAPGTVHAVVGENGAGKSTLMSLLYGLYAPDSGTIEVFGIEYALEMLKTKGTPKSRETPVDLITAETLR